MVYAYTRPSSDLEEFSTLFLCLTAYVGILSSCKIYLLRNICKLPSHLIITF